MTPGGRPGSASAAFTVPRAPPAEPEPAKPAASEREPEEAADDLGEDSQEEEQAGDAQQQGRYGPLEQGLEADGVHVDEAVDGAQLEPAKSNGESAVVAWGGSTAGSRGSGRPRSLHQG